MGVCFSNSPAHSKAFLAIITAIISFITAAAAIVPRSTVAEAGSKTLKVVLAMPVKTSETPEWGNSVSPKYFFTVFGKPVFFAPKKAPVYLPIALDIIYIAVNIPAPKIKR